MPTVASFVLGRYHLGALEGSPNFIGSPDTLSLLVITPELQGTGLRSVTWNWTGEGTSLTLRSIRFGFYCDDSTSDQAQDRPYDLHWHSAISAA